MSRFSITTVSLAWQVFLFSTALAMIALALSPCLLNNGELTPTLKQLAIVFSGAL